MPCERLLVEVVAQHVGDDAVVTLASTVIRQIDMIRDVAQDAVTS